MCNAWNHSAGCTCGWGGNGHAGRSAGGWPPRGSRSVPPRRVAHSVPARTGLVNWASRSTPVGRTRLFESYTNPNAWCPACGAKVFYYQSPNGGRVFFDELGPPWPKHPCTDRPNVTVIRAPSRAADRAARSGDLREPSWRAEGWNPVELLSAGMQDGAHFVEWSELDSDSARVRAYATEPVSIVGPTVASVMSWDSSGRTVISFIELDSEAPSRTLELLRAAPTEGQFIHGQLNRLVTEAQGLDVRVPDMDAVTRRLAAIDQQMTRWESHLTPDEVAPYRERYRQAQAGLATALTDAVEVKERLILEAETLATSTDPVLALARFQELKQTWDDERIVARSTEVKLRARFLAFEQFIVGARRRQEANQERERAVHAAGTRQESDLRIIRQIEALIGSADEETGRGQVRGLNQQWRASDRLVRAIESELTDRHKAADEAVRTGWASRRAKHSVEARRAAKERLEAEAEPLAEADVERDWWPGP